MLDFAKHIEAQAQGRYQLNEQIGSGAAGAVFRALDTKFDRSVIIKVLHKVSSKNSLRRFKAEAKALSRLDHENIVHLYDHIPDGERPCIILEDVEGTSLRDLDKEKELSVKDIVELIANSGRGLEAAHGAKIIHRDIKPENVIVTPQGTPKLIDFGLALDVHNEAKTRMTETGAVVGTIVYMAPELIRGSQASASSDVFALGVTLFELLAGSLPYHNILLSELLVAKTLEPDLALLPKEVDDDLKSIIAKMIAFDSKERFPSAKIARRRLDRWLGRSLSSHSHTKPKSSKRDGSARKLAKPQDGATTKRRLLPILLILGLAVGALFFWQAKTLPTKKFGGELTNSARLLLEQRVIDLRQKVFTTPTSELNSILLNHSLDLGKALHRLQYWRRLKLDKNSSELKIALVYLIRYSKEKNENNSMTEALYQHMFREQGVDTVQWQDYVKWASSCGLLPNAANFLQSMIPNLEKTALRQATTCLSKACVTKAEMRTPNARKKMNASSAFDSVFALYEQFLPALPDGEFNIDYKNYIAFLSACSGRSYQNLLKKTIPWLAKRSEICWSCRRLLAEALCLDFQTTLPRTKMAIDLQLRAIKEAPTTEKLGQEAFLTILYSRMAYDHVNANRMNDAIAILKHSLAMFPKLLTKAKGQAVHSLILCYYIDSMSTARFLAYGDVPSVKTITDTFKRIKKGDFKEDELFLYHLALSIVARERNEIEKAEQHLFDSMDICPTHWHNNLILRMTNLSFLKGMDLLTGQ